MLKCRDKGNICVVFILERMTGHQDQDISIGIQPFLFSVKRKTMNIFKGQKILCKKRKKLEKLDKESTAMLGLEANNNM